MPKRPGQTNKLQQSVLDNRYRLIKSEPAIDAYVAKQMAAMHKAWEHEIVRLLGVKRKWTATEVTTVARRMRQLQGRLTILTAAQVQVIESHVRQVARATYVSEAYKHAAMIQGHVSNFRTKIGVDFLGLNRRAIDAAYRQVVPRNVVHNMFGKVTQGVRARINRDVAKAITDGWAVDRLARMWAQQGGAMGFAAHQSQAVARTLVMQASSNAQLLAYTAEPGLVKGVQWEATFDSRTCPTCGSRHGRQYAANEAPAMPAHFNCVLPGNTVDPGSVIAASRSWYEGTVVEIRTKQGRTLTVTENHPVLTMQGFVSAGQLNVGDDLIGRADSQRDAIPVAPNANQEPSMIEDVFAALRESVTVCTASVPVAAEDFHGDAAGIVGKVDVVWADGLLPHHVDATCVQHGVQSIFQLSASDAKCLLSRASKFDCRLYRLRLAAYGAMGSGSQSHSFFGAGLGHANTHGVTTVARRDPGIGQLFANDVARDAQFGGQRKFTHAGTVSFDQSANVDGAFHQFGLTDASYGNTGRDQCAHDGAGVHTTGSCNGQLALPEFVAADYIVSIEHRLYAGHVYDLQTLSGLYDCSGIIIHNCRCTWLPVFVDEALNTQLDSRTAYKAPDNTTLTFKQQSREFDRYLARAGEQVQRDFFGSALKTQAWRAGKVTLDDLIDVHGRLITDAQLLKMVDPAWAKARAGLGATTAQPKPKFVVVPKGQLPVPKEPAPPEPVKPPVPIMLPPEESKLTLGKLDQ